ncbi:MAG: hypothetical protein AB7F09_10350 [Parvibaculaceae bacterium]
MRTRSMLAGVFVLAMGMGTAIGGEPKGPDAIETDGEGAVVIAPAADIVNLPPIQAPGSTCVSYRQWSSSSYIWRYCTSTAVAGYEVQRDDYRKRTTIQYTGSQLLDCDNSLGWYPSSVRQEYCN